MRYISQLFFILILSSYIGSVLAESGEALHQSACIECHSLMTGGDGSVLYKREDRIVQSMEALEKQVARCSSGANTDWNNTQLKSVIGYLNQEHYHF